MLCGYRFQKFIIAKVFFATALYYMLKQLTCGTQNFWGFLILQFLWLSKKEFQQKKLPQKNFLVLGALDVIVIEWWWLLHFVLHMHSIVCSIVLKSVSWLHILNKKKYYQRIWTQFLKNCKNCYYLQLKYNPKSLTQSTLKLLKKEKSEALI